MLWCVVEEVEEVALRYAALRCAALDWSELGLIGAGMSWTGW
jgi:hypothetical protein